VNYLTLAIVGVSLLAAGACSSGDSSSSGVPVVTAPALPAVTENFSGTVQVGGFDAKPFTVITSGLSIQLTLTAAGPPATIFMGFGVGSWDGTQCTLLNGGYGTYQAGTTPQLSGTINAGQYCMMVYDVGNLSAPVSYAVTMTHY